MSSTPKFSRFPAELDLRNTPRTHIALVAAASAQRGRRRDGTIIEAEVSSLAKMFGGNLNHCWRTIREWTHKTVRVTKANNGSKHRFHIAGGNFIKFPTWALTSCILTRLSIVAMLALCSGHNYKHPTKPIPMSRKSLRNRTGLSDRSLTKALDELTNQGVITKIHRFNKNGRRTATAYQINWQQPQQGTAREVTMGTAREVTMGTAREVTNISEGLFSEGFSSDPPPPQANIASLEDTQCTGKESAVASQEPATELIAELCRYNQTWAPLLQDANVTERDKQKIVDALQGVDPAKAAQALEAATEAWSVQNVFRPVGLLAFRLAQTVTNLASTPHKPRLNQPQRQMESQIAGEIAAGERQGPASRWQHLIDQLASPDNPQLLHV